MVKLFLFIIFIVLIFFIFYYCKNTESFEINHLLPNVYYINLEHRIDRKLNITKQLNNINYPPNKINRINAIKRPLGSTGCGLSHIKALEQALKDKQLVNYVIILEDDFEFKYNGETTKNIINNVLETPIDWNVILLSCNGNRIRYIDYLDKVKDCQTTAGYIIKLDYIPTLLDIWKTDMMYRENNYFKKGSHEEIKTCIDISWKKLQNNNWFVTKPIIGKQMISYSDIEKKIVNYKI